ncbi:hypothetical protein F0310_01295 [Borrelia sp. A-FGy1]|uniref:hypothetical protein n=1 Tax=Borrelia sp. A-FGy1 TaxID=2608247 RepID=UPI0015F52F08|nr:hypothetical protein [Borrelia sp. A-FGy1]QMU99063.1 hypothetical protein F0310_01295 [Borrelia sp. A-FGy1]
MPEQYQYLLIFLKYKEELTYCRSFNPEEYQLLLNGQNGSRQHTVQQPYLMLSEWG